METVGLRALALTACLLISTAPAASQDNYPSHTIRIIVASVAGGAPDVVARLVGHYLSESLGQPVVIENRSGANGMIGGEVAAKAAPDGYTLLLGADSGIVINPHVYAKMTYNPMKDLVPISTVATNQFILAVNPKLPVKTLKEFIDYAKKANPPLSFASAGVGSQHYFAMEQLKQRAGFNLLNVTFRSGAPAMQSTVAGDTQVFFAGGESAGQFEAGNLRPLAASGKARSKRYPDLPTIGETYPGYAVDIWLGLFAPAGTPAPTIAKLQKETQAVLARSEVAAKMNVSGSLEPLILPPAEFAARIRSDDEKYSKLAKELNLKIQ